MKKSLILIGLLSLTSLVSCGEEDNYDDDHIISVCCSEIPHKVILVNAVKPLLKKQGYYLKTKTMDWELQNDAVKNKDYDANYFQHRPYLQEWETKTTTYNPDYVYTTLFPVAGVHYEPLRIYAGKKSASQFASEKKTSSYVICNDGTNETRALDLLVKSGVITSYDINASGNPINLPSNIHPMSEEILASALDDYDYGVLPANTAMTGHINGDPDLPVEGSDVADLRTNVVAARVSDYASDSIYKAKIDALKAAVLDSSVATYILDKYNNVIEPYQTDWSK